MSYVLLALYDLILDGINALLEHFEKQKQPLVVFTLKSMRSNLAEFKGKIEDELHTLHNENEKLKNMEEGIFQNPIYLDQKRIHETQLNKLFERIKTQTPEMWPDEVAQMEMGNKIEAIRLYRQRTGAGLRESKDAVESYMLKNSIPKKTEPSNIVLL